LRPIWILSEGISTVIRVMRKYRKLILWAMVILIVPMFVVWGGYRSSGRRREQEAAVTGVVARVGSVAVSAEAFRQGLRAEADRRTQYGERPTYQEMTEDGTANRVLERLVAEALLDEIEAQRKFRCDRAYLVERLRSNPAFQAEDGRFDTTTWNAFIDSRKGRDWTAVYADVNSQVNREVLLETLKASARVLDAEVRDQFDENYSRMRIRHMKIEPKIEPTDEQVQAKYDEDPTAYQIPEQRVAEFVAISLLPPRPALVDELVERARAGEDFAGLAQTYSDWYDAQRGGAMGWVAEGPGLPDYMRAILELPVGEVSDPVAGANGYFIYTVEVERTNETTRLREVRGRQIQIRPDLTEEERTEREHGAEEILAKSKESGDLAPAAEAGLDVQTSGTFSTETREIENIPRVDVRAFVRGCEGVGAGEFADVIAARENLYVAKIVEFVPAAIQPLADVRDQVEQDLIEKIRNSDEYAEGIERLCKEIAAKAHSLGDIQTLYPELEAEITETEELTVKNSPMVTGTSLRSGDVYALFEAKGPGAFVGPIEATGVPQYFLELVALNPPSEEDWPVEKRHQEENAMRETALQIAQYRRLGDYIKYLKNRILIEYDNATFARVLGRDVETYGDETTAE